LLIWFNFGSSQFPLFGLIYSLVSVVINLRISWHLFWLTGLVVSDFELMLSLLDGFKLVWLLSCNCDNYGSWLFRLRIP